MSGHLSTTLSEFLGIQVKDNAHRILESHLGGQPAQSWVTAGQLYEYDPPPVGDTYIIEQSDKVFQELLKEDQAESNLSDQIS